jgi:hypothetical protein
MATIRLFVQNFLLGFGIDIQMAATSTFEWKKVGSSVPDSREGGGEINL